tara:strand:+ start:583 stop:822 length:240 start_codon:yes stop_codon:yes gene_type:complete
MIPTANTGNTVGTTHLTVTGIAIGVFAGDDVGQQGDRRDALTQRVNRTSRGHHTFFTGLFEHGLFLPVFEDFKPGGDKL